MIVEGNGLALSNEVHDICMSGLELSLTFLLDIMPAREALSALIFSRKPVGASEH